MDYKEEIAPRRKRKNRLIPLLILIIVVVSAGFGIKAAVDYYSRPLEIREAEEEIKSYAVKHGFKLSNYPSDIIELYAKNSEARGDILEYPAYKKQDAVYEASKSDEKNGMAYFLQWDKRWGFERYGLGYIATSACGPTSLSMVCTQLLGDRTLTPLKIAEFAVKNGYYVLGNGTSWTLMSEGAEKLGLTATELPLSEELVKNELNAGHPIICIMGPGDFTDQGHYIVLTSYHNGKVTVNDPNSVERSEKQWVFSEISGQIRNLWSYTA